MLLRLRVACRKEFTQFFRSKPLVILVLWMFAEIANCAWALSLDVRDLPLLVVDQDQSQASRALGERFRIAPYFAHGSNCCPTAPTRTSACSRLGTPTRLSRITTPASTPS